MLVIAADLELKGECATGDHPEVEGQLNIDDEEWMPDEDDASSTSTEDMSPASSPRVARKRGSRGSWSKKRSAECRWDKAQDNKLRGLVAKHGCEDWSVISKEMGNRSVVQCRHRWNKVLSPRVRGNWTDEEDHKIRSLVGIHGAANWATIASHLPGRVGKQCRERWHNHLRSGINKARFTEQEDRIILQMHAKVGSRWSEIAKALGNGRLDNTIKNHFNGGMKNKIEKYLEHIHGVPAKAPHGHDPETWRPPYVLSDGRFNYGDDFEGVLAAVRLPTGVLRHSLSDDKENQAVNTDGATCAAPEKTRGNKRSKAPKDPSAPSKPGRKRKKALADADMQPHVGSEADADAAAAVVRTTNGTLRRPVPMAAIRALADTAPSSIHTAAPSTHAATAYAAGPTANHACGAGRNQAVVGGMLIIDRSVTATAAQCTTIHPAAKCGRAAAVTNSHPLESRCNHEGSTAGISSLPSTVMRCKTDRISSTQVEVVSTGGTCTTAAISSEDILAATKRKAACSERRLLLPVATMNKPRTGHALIRPRAMTDSFAASAAAPAAPHDRQRCGKKVLPLGEATTMDAPACGHGLIASALDSTSQQDFTPLPFKCMSAVASAQQLMCRNTEVTYHTEAAQRVVKRAPIASSDTAKGVPLTPMQGPAKGALTGPYVSTAAVHPDTYHSTTQPPAMLSPLRATCATTTTPDAGAMRIFGSSNSVSIGLSPISDAVSMGPCSLSPCLVPPFYTHHSPIDSPSGRAEDAIAEHMYTYTPFIDLNDCALSPNCNSHLSLPPHLTAMENSNLASDFGPDLDLKRDHAVLQATLLASCSTSPGHASSLEIATDLPYATEPLGSAQSVISSSGMLIHSPPYSDPMEPKTEAPVLFTSTDKSRGSRRRRLCAEGTCRVYRPFEPRWSLEGIEEEAKKPSSVRDGSWHAANGAWSPRGGSVFMLFPGHFTVISPTPQKRQKRPRRTAST